MLWGRGEGSLQRRALREAAPLAERAGGEYDPQDGFGWTLGAAAAMVGRFHCASDV